MANLTVAVLGPTGYAKNLGKKGTSTDITFYNLKKGTATLTFIEPTRYPDRLAPLFYAVSMADAAVVVVDQLDATFGECLLMLQAAGVPRGFIVLRNYIAPEQVTPLLKGTALENYECVEDDPIVLRERLLDEAASAHADAETKETCIVPIDHFFNVRGIGTVVLGTVADGTLRKHDELRVFPTEKKALVRSIQKHDDDFDEASVGDRAGIALKNVDEEDFDRGYVLSDDPTLRCETTLTGTLDLVPFWKTPITEGMVLHLGHWVQYLPSRVVAVEGATVTVELEKELVFKAGSKAVVTYLEGGSLRVAGTITLE
ncbi:selenocysteine-specific translation elongation factor [Methanofollis sp. W23]|uniref:EF-Tu/IF-2/RF-3 family GTPase n=1 Tax=Methanofollis sp. W23 TaxID=2817849 RepID=UPI001AE79C4B|nr:EF-Tu/IF-2/RF-3 family GTPase [Methanofollis sp. W23]MBP2144951.1 selenocysteine-specific translation elongation factor [Methanofollis sp. W23]